MADTRLSDLSAAGALSASDLFYVVQTPGSGGEKATGTQLLTLVGTTYVPLAGGTMTGALTLPAGSVDAPSLRWTGAGSNTGLYSAGANNISCTVNGTRVFYVADLNMWIGAITTLGFLSNSTTLRFGSSNVLDPCFARAADSTIAIRNTLSSAATALQITTLTTDSSNYERLTLTGVAGTSVNITAETLGTGADDLNIVLTPAGAGSFKVPGNAGSGVSLNWYEFGARLSSGAEFVWTSGFTNASVDTGFRRNAAGIVEVNNGTAGTYRDLKLRNLIQTEYSQLTEMTAPAAPAANSVRIYAVDNGAGKTRLMALFATGSAVQIAIEP